MHDEDLEYSRIMGLVDGILLNVYDSVAISKKWDKRDISMVTLQKKKDMLLYFKDYFKTDNWDTWTDIYCEYFCKNKYEVFGLKYWERKLAVLRELQGKEQ